MIDNFELIAELIKDKTTAGEFYFLQILKRRKDNPELGKDMILIDNFFIKSAEDLLNKRERIIELCETNNARAYFRLNKRSERKIALQTLKLIADNIASDNYNIKNCYLSCCGQYHSDENKTWLIDIDSNDEEYDRSIQEFINTKCSPIGMKIISNIPTKNGHHLITRPFNLMEFRKEFEGVDIHKDNPTILYCK